MGKRGPRPKGEYGRHVRRTAVFSTRIQPDTHARLVSAATASGRSLSQEIEHRLRRTFVEDDKVIEFYGNNETAAVVKLIGAVIQSTATTISPKTNRKYEWLKDQFVFDNVMLAIWHVLLWFRPGGDSGLREITLGTATTQVDQLINEIRSSDPALQITTRSTRQHSLAMLKDKLGKLVTTRNPYDDLRKPTRPEPYNISNRLKRQQRKRQ
jgi:TraY domain